MKDVKEEAKSVPFLRLPAADRKKLSRHYKKKVAFYAQQDDTKWASWPEKEVRCLNDNRKTVIKKKNRNYKKRLARKTRKTKQDAKKAIETGGVVV